MKKMVSANSRKIAIPSHHDHGELRPAEFDPQSGGNGPAVGHMEAIRQKMGAGNPGSAANPANKNSLLEIRAGFLQRSQNSSSNKAISAAWAKRGGKRAKIFVQGMAFHPQTSRTFCASSSG
jgi:hypothetical protein